ncbi:MAG: EAL domain-containing protein [Clostridiales bacterium]|nr:EAL domain-containing protein [Clostridiales bacterium]
MKRKTILVVDDNEINRELLRDILIDSYNVAEAVNGEEALARLRSEGDEISLILLDMMMPVMNGYEFLSKAKADRELSLIPVIVLTQSDTEDVEIAAFSSGTTDFVRKPYRPEIIRHRIASLITLRETAAMANEYRFDRTTGLYTKAYFYQQAKELLEQHPEKEYDVICSNIENFKLYNDTFGVASGDELLVGIASFSKERIARHGICGRLGADRFMYLCERDGALREGGFEAFLEQINAMPQARGRVTLKWGVYHVEDRGVSIERMCDRAFLAGDTIKGQYGVLSATYDDTLREKLLREQALTDEMQKALRGGQFCVYYQPKISLNDGSLAGAEALVRWKHPELGFLSPGEFIPLFEKNGFISELDSFVWESVCAQLRSWRDKGLPAPSVSVNVSRAYMYQTDLPERLLALVQRFGLRPEELHLEVTESAYTESPGQIIATVRRLRQMGFIVELDDFGSGYSSLNMLNTMPLDILKLDMKFIQTEMARPRGQGILRFIVGMAKWMNLRVVAEGVETREQVERLREMGCDDAQGYYFSRPLPVAEFEATVLERSKAVQDGGEELRISTRKSAHVLIVDENETRRAQLAKIVSKQYPVLEAMDASSAIVLICEHEQTIAAMLLSVTLPEEGDARLLRMIAENKEEWRVPMLAMGEADAQVEERALALGADDYAVGPHTERGLLLRLERLMEAEHCRRRERRLSDEANRDYLTGLLNRRGLNEAMGAMTAEDAPAAVYLFDLDGLKAVNDRAGHKAGDELIRHFAETLRRHTRREDVLARYGGDEFVAVLRHMGSGEQAREKGDAICRAFACMAQECDGEAGCSAGVAVCPADGEIGEALIRRADRALYAAKQAGKGCCRLYCPEQG